MPVPMSLVSSYALNKGAVSKLLNAWRLLDRPTILTNGISTERIRSLSQLPDFEASLSVENLDELRGYASERRSDQVLPDDLALLPAFRKRQYGGFKGRYAESPKYTDNGGGGRLERLTFRSTTCR